MNLNPAGAAMDLGLNGLSADEQESEAEKARKKRLQLQQQRGGALSPYAGAAGSLLNPAGNQF